MSTREDLDSQSPRPHPATQGVRRGAAALKGRLPNHFAHPRPCLRLRPSRLQTVRDTSRPCVGPLETLAVPPIPLKRPRSSPITSRTSLAAVAPRGYFEAHDMGMHTREAAVPLIQFTSKPPTAYTSAHRILGLEAQRVPAVHQPRPPTSHPRISFAAVDPRAREHFEAHRIIHARRKAIIPLVESSAVLYALLPRVYPAHAAHPFLLVRPADLDDICAIHEGAHKFQMIRTLALIEDTFLTSPLLREDPHRFDSIRNITALVRRAVLCTLRDTGCTLRAQSIASKTVPSLHREMVSRSSEYLALGMAIIVRHGTTGQEFVWWREGDHAPQCGPTNEKVGGMYYTQEVRPPQWYRNHMRQLANSLRLLPNARSAYAEGINVGSDDRAAIAAWLACAQRALHDLVKFSSQLGNFIEALHEQFSNEVWD
ncbi:hypothetical protein DFH09DRAFT_1308431 [Mycena vulgaris]|nr:hypothetical protein DFH09DRAFT_1308431 [Mycena vulgaris]